MKNLPQGYRCRKSTIIELIFVRNFRDFLLRGGWVGLGGTTGTGQINDLLRFFGKIIFRQRGRGKYPLSRKKSAKYFLTASQSFSFFCAISDFSSPSNTDNNLILSNYRFEQRMFLSDPGPIIVYACQ